MNTYIVIGAPGQGKSPIAQALIENRRCLVFDVNNEYGSRTKYAGQKPISLSSNTNEHRSRYIDGDVKKFMEIAEKKRNTVIVFEEATAFFRGSMSMEVSRLLINKKHTGNSYVFLFHSINRVPPEIMEMCDYVVLLRTNDQEDTVFRKYKSIAQHFLDAQMFKQGEYRTIKMIQ